jgi:hypothetical protein
MASGWDDDGLEASGDNSANLPAEVVIKNVQSDSSQAAHFAIATPGAQAINRAGSPKR